MTCMITDSSFNINSTLIAQGLELKSKIYLKQNSKAMTILLKT